METIDLNMKTLLEKMHENKDVFSGGSLKRHIPKINNIIESNNIETILDYGCGKAKFHPKEWNATLYDPGYSLYSKKPEGNFDLVICTDVMEHVEEKYIDNVLDEIFSYANTFVYFCITTTKASKHLPDGRNCHVTVQPKEWWEEKINRFNTKKYVVFL